MVEFRRFCTVSVTNLKREREGGRKERERERVCRNG